MGLSEGTPPHGLSMGPGLPRIMVAGLKGKGPERMGEPCGHHVTFADLL